MMQRLLRRLNEPDYALNAAAFRVAFLLTVLHTFDPKAAFVAAGIDASLRIPPPGYAALMPLIPFDATTALAAGRIFQICCVAGLIGFRTRYALMTAFGLSIYVYGLPQFFGKIDHTHHVIWLLGILALCRCADALSIDAFLGRKRGIKIPEKSDAYAFCLNAVWAAYAMVYFFPGFWKLLKQGPSWMSGENLRDWLHFKWFELGNFEPAWRIDLSPTLMSVFACAVLTFELLFFIGVIFRRVRPLLIIAAIAFHLSVAYFMNIGFKNLWLPLLGLFDWYGIIAIFHRPKNPPERQRTLPPSFKTKIAVSSLLFANVFCGFLYLDTWPFGTYPTFASRPPTEVSTLRIEAMQNESAITPTSSEAWVMFGGSARWLTVQRRLIADPKPEKCTALWDSFTKKYPRLQGAASVRFFSELRSTDPALKHAPPLEIREICTQ